MKGKTHEAGDVLKKMRRISEMAAVRTPLPKGPKGEDSLIRRFSGADEAGEGEARVKGNASAAQALRFSCEFSLHLPFTVHSFAERYRRTTGGSGE